MDGDHLYLRAGELLVAAEALLPSIGRVYVALDRPALDCPDQLTVHVSSLGRQAGGGGPLADFELGLAVAAPAVNTTTFVVTIVRCAPTSSNTGNPPPTLAYEHDTQRLLCDLWLLWKGIPAAVRSGELWDGVCDKLVLGPAVTIPESGGFAGWQVGVTAEVS